VLNVLLTVAIVAMAWMVLTEKRTPPSCLDFHHFEEVAVVEGDKTGAVGLVMRVKHDKAGQCLYMVRAQLGTEVPFIEWYASHELFSLAGE